MCGRVEWTRKEFAIPANTEGVALESFLGCASWAEFGLETGEVSTPQFGNHPNAGIRDSHFQFRILGLNTYIETGCNIKHLISTSITRAYAASHHVRLDLWPSDRRF
jgi:hypothetical protein